MKDSTYIKMFNKAAKFYKLNERYTTKKGLHISVHTVGYSMFKKDCNRLIKATQNSIAFNKGFYKYEQLNELFRQVVR